jgi:spore coat protein U-like protein
MRKLLLASTAIALATGVATAADSSGVQVSATVSAWCTMSDPDDVTFGTDPEVGDTDSAAFDFTCNFVGDGGEGPGALTVTFASTNGGLKNVDDAEVRDYTVDYNSTGPVLASALAPYSETSASVGLPNARSFEVELAEALPVAGAYDDTLTISIAP